MRRRWGRGLGAVAAVAALAVSARGCTGTDGDDARPTTTSTPLPTVVPHDGWALVDGEPVAVPDPPAPHSGGNLVALDDVFVLHGDPVAGEVGPIQTFEPKTGDWTILSAAPFDLPVQFQEVVSVEGGFLLLGAECATYEPDTVDTGGYTCEPGVIVGARYDLAEGSWRVLDLPAEVQPADGRTRSAAWAVGRAAAHQVVVEFLEVSYAYRPSTDRWQRLDSTKDLADSSVVPRIRCATDIGTAVVSAPNRAELERASGDPIWGTDRYRAAVVDDDGTWVDTAMDLPPVPVGSNVQVVCTDTSVVVVGSGQTTPYALEFDVASRAWASIPMPPFPVGYQDSAVVNGGAVILIPEGIAGEGTYRYERDGHRWSRAAANLDVEPFEVLPDGIAMGRPFNSDGANSGPAYAVDLTA